MDLTVVLLQLIAGAAGGNAAGLAAGALRRCLVPTLTLATLLAPPAHAQRSYAMRFECRTAEPST